MRKYRVKYCVEEIYYTDVEANNKEEAMDKADAIEDQGMLINQNENIGKDLISVEEINKIGETK